MYLGTVVGGSCLLAAWPPRATTGGRGPPVVASSAVMLSWIAAELGIIGYRSSLQPAIAATGAAVGYLALKR